MKLPWKHAKKEPLTPWEEAIQIVCKKWKRYERKRKYYKIYLFVLFILPIFASILTVKVVKTYVKIKLRQIAVRVPSEILKEAKTSSDPTGDRKAAKADPEPAKASAPEDGCPTDAGATAETALPADSSEEPQA